MHTLYTGIHEKYTVIYSIGFHAICVIIEESINSRGFDYGGKLSNPSNGILQNNLREYITMQETCLCNFRTTEISPRDFPSRHMSRLLFRNPKGIPKLGCLKINPRDFSWRHESRTFS